MVLSSSHGPCSQALWGAGGLWSASVESHETETFFRARPESLARLRGPARKYMKRHRTG